MTTTTTITVEERLNKLQKKPEPKMAAAAPAGLNEMPPHQRLCAMSDNARIVLGKRYLRRGPDGEPVETINEMFWRVARFVAAAETAFGEDPRTSAALFYDMLTDLRFLPNSPTFTGAGTPLGQLAACFVLPLEDDMGQASDGIFQTLRDAALIQQTGGGNGFAFSRLRPKNALVQSSMGQASGPVGFLRVYDNAFGEIAQGGTRRGANMAVLQCDHPDIEEFINCKTSERAITNFNISVGVTDAFMQAVSEDGEIDLIAPHNGEKTGSIRARALFDKIATKAHHNGEPGVLFLDTANKSNPVPHLYTLEATNPCGEQWLGPYESCCLGSINLARHTNGNGGVDWKLLQQTVAEATTFLDDVVTANAYVPAVPQLKLAAERCRRIGLGIMGLADLMYHCGIRYGSEEGQEFGAQVMEFVRYHTMHTSVSLAKLRGRFPAFEGSVYDPHTKGTQWQIPTPLTSYQCDYGRPVLDWAVIQRGIANAGIRNAAQNTVAPTGTISTVAGCEGYGCEPVFALAYVRNVTDNGKILQLHYTSPEFECALRTAEYTDDQIREVAEVVSLEGTCQTGRAASMIPAEIRRVFVTSSDVTTEEHIRQQAALQRFVDNSISKTVNMPNSATVDDVKEAYQLAWELGCKGVTVYRTGSRDTVVLETKSTAVNKKQTITDCERPMKLRGSTYRVETPLGVTYVTINEGSKPGIPFEVFLQASKAGSETAAVTEALGRLISHILRMRSPISPRERMANIVQQLRGIGGQRTLGLGPRKVRSLPDGIAQMLREYLQDSGDTKAERFRDILVDSTEALERETPSPTIGDLCPECGQATYVYAEGCKKCTSCGLSEC